MKLLGISALVRSVVAPLFAPLDSKIDTIRDETAAMQAEADRMTARAQRLKRYPGLTGAIDDIARELGK